MLIFCVFERFIVNWKFINKSVVYKKVVMKVVTEMVMKIRIFQKEYLPFVTVTRPDQDCIGKHAS